MSIYNNECVSASSKCKKMIDIGKLKLVIKRIQHLVDQYPTSVMLKSALDQLLYIRETFVDPTADKKWLETLNVGWIAARDIESMDAEAAKLIYEILDQVDVELKGER